MATTTTRVPSRFHGWFAGVEVIEDSFGLVIVFLFIVGTTGGVLRRASA